VSERPPEHVMIPVPEEHVSKVHAYLTWRAPKVAPDDWDRDAVVRQLDQLDPLAREFLVAAAADSYEVDFVSVPDAARRHGVSEREILGLIIELNHVLRVTGGPLFSFVTVQIPDEPDEGPRSWSVNMAGDVARFVLIAAGRDDPAIVR
jgi:hypothetical protein